jgi:hypothetical protein
VVENQLNDQEVNKLLRVDPKSPGVVESDKWWKTHKAELLACFHHNQDTVTIDGRVFGVERLKEYRIKLTPVEGFVPCGVVSKGWLESQR